MKKSKVENLQGRIDRAQERLAKTMDTAKALKQEIAKLEKEKEEAEMAELQGFMKEYDISPAQARAIIAQMQATTEIEKEGLGDEEGSNTDPDDAGRV